MKAGIIFLALLIGSLDPHDFFISILTIRHTPEKKSLDLTWQITAHDIEHTLSPIAKLDLGSTSEHPQADSLLNAYFREHLHISVAGAELDWLWVGKELESENLFCYLQIEDLPSVPELTVHNDLMQETFPQQENLVHIEGANIPTRSYTFLRASKAYTFAW